MTVNLAICLFVYFLDAFMFQCFKAEKLYNFLEKSKLTSNKFRLAQREREIICIVSSKNIFGAFGRDLPRKSGKPYKGRKAGEVSCCAPRRVD